MSTLSVFDFQGHSVRFVGTPDKPEWVARDVAGVLYGESGANNASSYLSKVPDKWKGVRKIHTLGGEQDLVTLLEPGLYFFLARSSSPVAVPFQDWLFEEVLPSIRKTGSYSLPHSLTPDAELAMQQYLRIAKATEYNPKLVMDVAVQKFMLDKPVELPGDWPDRSDEAFLDECKKLKLHEWCIQYLEARPGAVSYVGTTFLNTDTSRPGYYLNRETMLIASYMEYCRFHHQLYPLRPDRFPWWLHRLTHHFGWDCRVQADASGLYFVGLAML